MKTYIDGLTETRAMWFASINEGFSYLENLDAAISAARQSEEGPQPDPNAPSDDYHRGWDDCLESIFKTLGDRYPRRVASPPPAPVTTGGVELRSDMSDGEIYARVSHSLSASPAETGPASAETGSGSAERGAARLQELHEIADGAYGDNPMIRGLARDEILKLEDKK